MANREDVAKFGVLLALVVILANKALWRAEKKGIVGVASQQVRDQNGYHLIRNTMPKNIVGAEMPLISLNPLMRVYDAAETRLAVNLRQSPILQEFTGWLKGFLALFKGQRTTKKTAAARRNKTKLNSTNLHHDNKRAHAYQRTDIDGIGVAYFNPFPVQTVRGIALLIHGCGQEASDWFQLPEHRHIASQLVRERLALLAVTSSNRVSGCWSTRFPPWKNDDVKRIAMATRKWAADQALPPGVPMHAVGVSSGATMLSVLSTSNLFPDIVTQALYISPGNQRAFRSAGKNYPSTLFVHLTTDDHYASPNAIASARKSLLARNVSLVGELGLGPVKMTPLTVHQREPHFNAEVSRKIFEEVKERDGELERTLQSTADELAVGTWSKKEILRSLRQIFRVVRGYHEVSALHADKVAKWLVTHAHRDHRHGGIQYT